MFEKILQTVNKAVERFFVKNVVLHHTFFYFDLKKLCFVVIEMVRNKRKLVSVIFFLPGMAYCYVKQSVSHCIRYNFNRKGLHILAINIEIMSDFKTKMFMDVY